jgi:hypothetical protein
MLKRNLNKITYTSAKREEDASGRCKLKGVGDDSRQQKEMLE